jgi:GNAT superfamily N-acetyltransferase
MKTDTAEQGWMPGHKLRVRHCEARDEEAYIRLNLAFMEAVKQGSAYWSSIPASTAPQMRKVFGEIMALQESMQIFVAELDGIVVGYANAYTVYSVWSRGKALTIDDLYVEAGHRGAGIGRALMEHIDAFAAANGYKRIQLHAEVKNTGAQKLYLSLGFEAEDMRFFLKRLDMRE